MALNQLELLFDMAGSHKKRVPCGPKPTASRPVRARARKTGEATGAKLRSAAEEECANNFVNDLIQGALAEDVNVATEDVTFYESDEDCLEDDVFSLADPSEDEEVESLDLANVLAKRVVQQGIQLDMQIQASFDDAADDDFAEVEDFDEDDGIQQSLEDLRAKVGSTLVSAAQDGSLGASLAQVRAELQAEEDAAIKKEARETLLRAAKSGTLSSALRSVSKAAPSPLDLEALRVEARDTLLCAARDGSLASALQEAREESEPSKPDVELLRQEARDTLLRAAGDGRLAAAFRSVREASKVAQEANKAQKGEDLEKLRHEAAQALVAAAQNGKLAEALSSRKPEVDVEALRLEARSTMIRAAQDGSLREALQEARVETLRAEARDRLLSAARDGRLAAALQRKPAVSEDRASLEEIREKAKSALLKTLDTGDFQKAMESIRQKRETKAPAIVESRPFHLCPSVGTWLLPPQFQVQAPAQPQPVEQAVEEQQVCAAAVPDRPASPTRAMGRTKRRIIGAVVRVPTESLPVDPQPPATSPKSNRPWVMAGAPAAGLRTKEPLAFHMDDDSSGEGQSGGLVRKSSITAMFEAMGSTQLYRMDTLEDDKAPSRPSSSVKLATPGMFKSASAGSVSAMALDMGLPATPLSMDVSSKKERLGTPGMGSRCSSVGALRSLRASKSVKQGGMLPFLKPNSAIDWSVSHVQSVMSMKTHEWSTMAPSPVL